MRIRAESGPRSRWGSAREQSGFSLVELVLALSITAMMVLTLGGLVTALQSAWTVSTRYQTLSIQGRASLERMRWMISQAGTYSTNNGSTQLGLKVITRTVDSALIPDVLVVWSGGRSGGVSSLRQPALSLPKINELVIYAPDPSSPNVLIELVVSSNTSTIDFSSSGFDTTIQSLISSSVTTDRVSLVDCLRTCRLTTSGTLLGNLRFEVLMQPSDENVTGTVVGSDNWYALPWCQGMSSPRGGLRQATVRIEFQVETNPQNVTTGVASITSMPVIGCGRVTYAYRA